MPPASELAERVGTIYRRRIDLALDALAGTEDPERRAVLERHLDDVARWLERVAELARPMRQAQRQERRDTTGRVRAALDTAADALQRLDPATFRHRAPAHCFDVSGAEGLWASVLAAGYAIARLSEEVAASDDDFWWRVYDTSPREEVTIDR
ncbi:MAG: hypothetical protein ACRD2J_14085 [Thermoanaerobaculia bacterium]